MTCICQYFAKSKKLTIAITTRNHDNSNYAINLFYSIMILIVTMWIILITTSHHVESDKVIIVNNNFRNTTDCCVKGKENCNCSSLFMALQCITDSTTVNITITSESVELHSNATLHSASNIRITSSNRTVIKCNNTGSVSFINTTNVTIHGITWDQCGNPNGSRVDGGISFANITKLTIDNCTFQHSQMCAVSLSSVSDDITIKNSYFMSNGLRKTTGSGEGDCGGLKINAVLNETVIVIKDCVFSGNGKSIDRQYYPIYGLFIEVFELNQVNITLTINRTNFVSNFGGMYLKTEVATFSTFILSEVNVSDNINEGIKLPELQIARGDINLMVLNSTFSNNGNGGLNGYIFAYTANSTINVVIENTNFTDNRAVNFSNRALTIAISSADTTPLSVYVQHSSFVNNKNGTIYISTSQGKVPHLVRFKEVVIKECVATGSYSGSVSVSLHSSLNNTYYFQSVFFIANNYSGITGGALFLKTVNAENDIFITNCEFQSNSGLGEGAAFYVADGVMSNANVYQTIIKITDVNFINNKAGDSIVYVEGGSINNTRISLEDTSFTNNIGTALRLFMSRLTFYTYVLFENNTANSGGALYLEQGSQVYFGNKYANLIVQFVNNTATQYGGVIYTDLPSTCPTINGVMFSSFNWNFKISFMSNKAGIIGNSMYFNIHEFCEINTNANNSNSLLYFPYKFNYSEAHNTAIVTSPHSVELYFPNHDGSYISNKTVFIRNKILGKTITFTGAVFDYFSSPAEPTQFHVKCLHGCTNYKLANNHNWLLVDNVSLLSMTLSGSRVDDFNPINITFALTSILASFNEQIKLQLIIELSPCYSGYFYDVHSNTCACYNHKDIVECYDDYNEIKRGYWFGTVTYPPTFTVSLCPSRYCYFGKHRQETRQGYCFLPSTLDGQCHSHRTGVACGECKTGYTLAYDLPNCINTDKCSVGMTILVIVLTILYWIAVVAAVFVLMHFSHKYNIPSNYAYGIIYYYSIVDILLNNNPYISDAVFQVVAVLSSFAKLTPQLFGQLCLAKGLSGIDQQFIHYTHALAVILILLSVVLVARYSPRLALYVRRYILRVICILLLLSYTSLASTSLQLLQATQYPGYDGLYVYVSPDMKYFNGRHAFYGVVALLCGAIVVIGLPLFLLLEPLILNRWFNFIRVMPLLDQFQSCYKDEYRWFAAYYLICRQVIIIIVYFGNDDYYEMLYYLQTVCVVIAMLHIWTQPYKIDFLNAFDGVVLLTIILVVNANTFTFLSSATSVIIVILVLLPLIVFCIASSKKLILRYIKKLILCFTKSQDQQQYNNLLDSTDHVNTDDDKDNNTNYGRYSYIHIYIYIICTSSIVSCFSNRLTDQLTCKHINRWIVLCTGYRFNLTT